MKSLAYIAILMEHTTQRLGANECFVLFND
jgi:hypothetical protein